MLRQRVPGVQRAEVSGPAVSPSCLFHLVLRLARGRDAPLQGMLVHKDRGGAVAGGAEVPGSWIHLVLLPHHVLELSCQTPKAWDTQLYLGISNRISQSSL